jgi:hypothetical protein
VQLGLTVIDAGEDTGPVQRALDTLGTLDRGSIVPLDFALAFLAAGWFERVRAAIHAAAVAPADAVLPLVTARYVAWTGDLHTAAAGWQHVRNVADALFSRPSRRPAGSGHDMWLRALTAEELQRTATDLGDAMFAASLHRHARAAADTGVTYAAAGSVAAGSPSSSAILDFVHGLLGVEPDATRHRIRIRPRLTNVSSLDVRQLRFGDGEIRIRARTSAIGGAVRYTLEVAQDSGAIPTTLVLEPLVPGRVLRAFVDGRAADLGSRPHADGDVMVPVQLVLDEQRRIEIDVED